LKVLEWPDNSPDINPIENLWMIMKRKVTAKHPKNIEELRFLIGLISGLLSGPSRTFKFDRRKKFYKICCKILKECLILKKYRPQHVNKVKAIRM
jgi:transposase